MIPPMRRSLRRDKHRATGWILGGIGAAVLAAFAVTAIILGLNRTKVDRVSGCALDHYESITAVLIDLTDTITPTQLAALKNALLSIRNEVPQHGRLEIYPLRSTAISTLEPIFEGCNPGSGRDVHGRILENRELAERIWKRVFADKVEAVIDEIKRLPSQSSSPLFEGVQSVAVTAFGSPLAQSISDKRLVIVSDMIHHTADLSMYQGVPTFERFKPTPYYARVRPSLRSAQIDVLLIVRDAHQNVQQPPLYKFWVDFVTNSNGFLRNWEPLQ